MKFIQQKLQIKVNGLENFIIAIRDFYNFNFAPRTFLFLFYRCAHPNSSSTINSKTVCEPKGRKLCRSLTDIGMDEEKRDQFPNEFPFKGKKEKVEKFHLIEFQR